MNNDAGSTELSEQPDVNLSSAPEQALTPDIDEEMIPKSQVESIVHGRLKDKNAQWERKFQEFQHSIRQEAPSQISKVSDEVKRQVAAELEAYKHAAQQAEVNEKCNQILSELNEKFAAAKANYPDFDEVVNEQTLQEGNGRVALIAAYANQFDNAGDIMYELLNNGTKIGALMHAPAASLQRDLARLSQSLKANKDIDSRPQVRAPLSQLTSSNVPPKPNSGSLGPEAYRKKFRV